MFAMLAEAAVERGEGEIRGKEEAKAEGVGRKGGVDGGEDPKGRTRRVELSCEVPSLVKRVSGSRYESDVSRLIARIPRSLVA